MNGPYQWTGCRGRGKTPQTTVARVEPGPPVPRMVRMQPERPLSVELTPIEGTPSTESRQTPGRDYSFS